MLPLLFIALCIGCGSEPFYDLTSPSWYLLLATDTPELQLRHEPGNSVVVSDLYAQANGSPLPAPVQDMELFRNTLFLFLPKSVELLDANSYKRRARLHLPASPDGIAFPNATSGYIWHRSAGMLSLIDLLTDEYVRTFSIGGQIGAVAASDAMLYITEEKSSYLLVFDTRTWQVQDSLPLPPRPRFIALREGAQELVVASIGSGDDSAATLRAPRLSLIRLRPLRLVKSIPLSTSADSARIRLTGLVTTPDDFAYVGTSAGLFRVDLRSQGSIRLVQQWNIRNLWYLPNRGEFWFLTAGTPQQLIIAAGSRAEPILSTSLPSGTTALLPLP